MLRSSVLLRCCLVFVSFQAIVFAAAVAHAQATPVAAPELRVFDPSLIDKSVDPCDNFYRYSCNGWFSYGRFTELHELNRLHLRQILEQAAAPTSGRSGNEHPRSANEQKIGDEYASCMDTATIDKLGIAPLKPELDRIAALTSATRRSGRD